MKLAKLGDICEISTGSTDTKDAVENGQYPLFDRSKKVKASDKYLFDCEALIMPGEGAEFLPRYYLGKFDLHQRAYAMFNFSNLVDPKYLYFYLISVKDYFANNAVGATVKSLRRRHFTELEVPLPSLEKQREIVAKLDSAFAQIDSLKENLSDQQSAVSEITSGKLDQIFSRKSELDKEIRQVRLSEIARVINGRAYSQPELLKQGPYPVLRVGNFFSNRSWYYSDLELEKDKYCDNGDLLYAWSASFGPRVWDGGKVIYHYHIWKIEEKKELVLRDWLYWWFLWDVKQIKEAHGTGSTMMHVTKGAMENRLVQLPSLKVQSQQVQEIAELQLATQKLESNYKAFAENWSELKNVVLASAFENAVA